MEKSERLPEVSEHFLVDLGHSHFSRYRIAEITSDSVRGVMGVIVEGDRVIKDSDMREYSFPRGEFQGWDDQLKLWRVVHRDELGEGVFINE